MLLVGTSVDVERKVTRVDFPVRAIGDDGAQRLVDPPSQILVLLAHGDPDALVEFDPLADEGEGGAGRSHEPAIEPKNVAEDGVHASACISSGWLS